MRARRGESLFGEQPPWSKSDAKKPLTPNSESFREAALPAHRRAGSAKCHRHILLYRCYQRNPRL